MMPQAASWPLELRKSIFTRKELQNEFHRKFILNFFQVLWRRGTAEC